MLRGIPPHTPRAAVLAAHAGVRGVAVGVDAVAQRRRRHDLQSGPRSSTTIPPTASAPTPGRNRPSPEHCAICHWSSLRTVETKVLADVPGDRRLPASSPPRSFPFQLGHSHPTARPRSAARLTSRSVRSRRMSAAACRGPCRCAIGCCWGSYEQVSGSRLATCAGRWCRACVLGFAADRGGAERGDDYRGGEGPAGAGDSGRHGDAVEPGVARHPERRHR